MSDYSDEGESLGKAEVVRETEKALLIYIRDRKEELWFPKSVIHDDSEVYSMKHGSDGELIVKRWFAEKEGLL